MIATAILINIILLSNVEAGEYVPSFSPSQRTIHHNYCDKIFNESFFQEVSPELNKLCRNRFIFLTNQIKVQLPKYTFNQNNSLK